MDARHQFLIGAMVSKINMQAEEVEEILLDGDQVAITHKSLGGC